MSNYVPGLAVHAPGDLTSNIKVAVRLLRTQGRELQKWLDYYEGRQPLQYISQAMEDLLAERGSDNRDYVVNICSLATDAYYDRLALSGVQTEDAALEEELTAWLKDPEVQSEIEDANRYALVYPVSYVMIFPDAAGMPELDWQDPRYTVTFTSPNNRREVSMAAKWWSGRDGGVSGTRLNLYYTDRLVKLFAPNSSGALSLNAGAYKQVIDEDAEVYYDTWSGVPVVPMLTRRPYGMSLFADILPEQNRINQLSAAKLIAQEFGILPQRYLIGAAQLKEGALTTGPAEVWEIPEGAVPGQFEAMGVEVFDTAIDREIDRVIVKKRLPRWYIQMQGGDPSGEALKTSEAGMIKHVRELQLYLGPVWRRVFGLYAAMRRYGDAVAREQWATPESQALTSEIQQFTALVGAGVPLRTALREVWGWDDEKLTQMEADYTAEQTQRSNPGVALIDAFNRGEMLPLGA